MLGWHTVSAKTELVSFVSLTPLLKGYIDPGTRLGARVTGF